MLYYAQEEYFISFECYERKKYLFQIYLYFVYSFDVILTNTPAEVIRKFQKFDARVVFSAEGFCWPDKSLAVCITVLKGQFCYLIIYTLVKNPVSPSLKKNTVTQLYYR